MMYLSHQLTNDIYRDVKEYFLKFNHAETWLHTEKVLEKLNLFEHNENHKLACLMHDLGRVVKKEDIITFCQSFGIDYAEELTCPSLLHQKISRHIAREIFKVGNESILMAIEYHTSSRANPSRFEKIVFLSDKLSWDEEAHMETAELVNKSLEKSIDYAMFKYLEKQDLEKDKMLVYLKDSKEAYNHFKSLIKS